MLKGKKHSEETRKKLREAKARLYDNEGISNRKGAKHTIESKRKMSIAHKGQKHSDFTLSRIEI